MTAYKIGTGTVDDVTGPLVLVGETVHKLSDVLGSNAPATLEEVMANWTAMDAQIEAALESVTVAGVSADDVTFATPIGNPRKVICIGTNYHDHLQEMKVTTLPEFPYAFMRPQTCLAAHGESIDLPAGSQMIDWEAELGIVIGSRFGPGDSGSPLNAVAGYTVLNDVSARDWIIDRPWVGIDWVMQKAWDKFQPTGPWITPSRFVSDPMALDIELTVNGVTKQKSNTSQLIFGLHEILTHLTGIMTLEPGDIIATGTPAGVGFGMKPQEFLKGGDHVAVTIEGLGTLENTFK
tara:strand:+ start:1259 stop:2137 length:879 start_codon:yes stop_codon:yes gene_type:complete